MPLIFLFFLFSSIKFLRGNDKYLILSLFLIGLGFHFQSAFAIFLFPLLLILIIIKYKLPSFKTFLFGIILFLFSISNFILFELRHKFLMSHAVLKLFSGKTPPMHDYEQFANLGFRISDRLSGLREYIFLSMFDNQLFIKLLIMFLLSVSVVWVFKLQNKNSAIRFKKEFILILSIPLLYYFLYIGYPYPLWSHYTISLTVPSCLLVSFSIIKILDFKWGSWLTLILLILLLFSPLRWIFINYGTKRFNEKLGSYKNQLTAAEFIFNDTKGKQFGYLVYDHGQLTYHMDYLMWWLANKKYHVPLINNKQSLTYLIMYEPPIWAKGAHAYWKENVIKTKGKIINKKIFPNGITVEKLQIGPDESSVDPNYFQNLIFR